MTEHKKIVLASGVFDLIHYGHVKFLERAKKKGGKNAELFVVVARDSYVKRSKGEYPILPEEERRALVESLKPVDKAFLGYEKMNMSKIIETNTPDVIALGYDQHKIEQNVKALVNQKGYNVKVVRIERFGRDLDSSSQIKHKIASNTK
ncbi:MAG: adenylyltransferase/cytidyltransferase family protein [Candidatus Bathyarchaeota archaeon]